MFEFIVWNTKTCLLVPGTLDNFYILKHFNLFFTILSIKYKIIKFILSQYNDDENNDRKSDDARR